MSENQDTPIFRGFDPYAPVRIYRRNLPHWRQDSATYFATFRLADSIPKQVMLKWQDEDQTWLRGNGIEGPLSEPRWQAVYDVLPEKARSAFEERAARRLHLELDECHGACLLREPQPRRVAANALRHFDGTRWWVGDFVAMPNHIHGLFQPMEGHELEEVLASVKGYVSTQLTKQGWKTGRLWQPDTYDRLVRDREELDARRRYVESNPTEAGLKTGGFTYYRCGWLDET